MAVTIKNVASAAGVSTATASRALNGATNVTQQTRDRVIETARSLGYFPNSAARSLSTRRTHCIGVVLPDLYGEFFSELIRGIDRAARRHGLTLLLSGSHGDGRELASALRSMRGRVDGLLVMSPHVDGEVLRQNLPPSIPLVLVNTPSHEEGFAALNVDNFGGASAMVRHLIGRGHQRIAMIAGPEPNFDARERLRGYREMLAELRPGVAPLVLRGDFSEESGYRAGRQIASMPQRPDAVFAANDAMAIGCLFALSEAGVAVPDDVALAGFDDVALARFVTPPLTTVRVRIAELGELALERLATAMTAGAADKATAQTLRTELVIRSSCARAQASGFAILSRGSG
jgi:LacI family transcriptional regulator